MTAWTPACGCPEADGKIRHQRGTCTDPVAARLDWYTDGPAQTAGTPGQAEYETWRAAVPDRVCNVPAGPWDELSPGIRAGFAAIAAQGARPAPGVMRDAETGEPLPPYGGARPAPGRADEFARVEVRLCALIDSLDETVSRGVHTDSEFDQGAAHASAVTARQLRKILDDTALGTTPQPAPELAAAMAESRELRDYLDDFTRAVINVSNRPTLTAMARDVRKRNGLPS